MTWQVPWVISGVSEIPLQVARVMSYAASGGGEGVVGATDLQVKQTASASTSITIDSGAFVALNRYSAGSPESYIGYNVGQLTQAVPTAGVGGRTDMIAAIIKDSGQTGGGVSGPVETVVIQSVSGTALRLQDVPAYANTAGYALARIAVPASGANITQAMITDLRGLSQTKRLQVVKVASLASGAAENTVTGSWGLFPNNATWAIDIPSWATRATVVGHVAGMEVRGTTGQSWVGQFRIKAGPTKYSTVTDVNVSVTSGTKDTAATMLAGDVAIIPGERGLTSQTFRLEAIKSSGAATMYAQHGTVVVLEVTFYNQTEVV